jgi:hypothetical protein
MAEELSRVPERWVVVSDTAHGPVAYVFTDPVLAAWFAEWFSATVDPAGVVAVHDPLREMLTWYRAEQARNNAGEVGGEIG